jgi:crossover junction endodeoxyribonuclease RuvC
MIVCAIDVGLQVCGYVICATKNTRIKLIKEGEIKTRKTQNFAQKLNYIFNELSQEIDKHRPQAVILEKLYSHYRHPTTLGVLAQVRGVVVLLTQRRGLALYEYAPTRARKSFLGRGSASSEQVRKMAQNFTGETFKSNHTADAFSLVVAFSHEEKVKNLDMVIQ